MTKSVVQVLTTGFGLSSDNEKTDTAYLRRTRHWRRRHSVAGRLIVTNAHVVEGARKIRVRLQGMEKQSAGLEDRVGRSKPSWSALTPVRLGGAEDRYDGLPALELADSNELKQGQVVFAFGSPLGLENSVTHGRRQRDRAPDRSR